MFSEVDPVLGPEMRATGEVMGIGDSFGLAYCKSQEATGLQLPEKGNVLITVADRDKKHIIPVAKKLKKLGFNIYATKKTGAVLKENGVENTEINKIDEGRPDIADFIKNKDLQLIINTLSAQAASRTTLIYAGWQSNIKSLISQPLPRLAQALKALRRYRNKRIRQSLCRNITRCLNKKKFTVCSGKTADDKQ